MDRDALSKRLMVLFLGELEEHEQTLERDLLALERQTSEDERGALIESVFRAAHSLKGASRAVRATTIETICHRLEQSLSTLRGSSGTVDPERMQALFSEVDNVKAAAARLRVDAALEQSASAKASPVTAPMVSTPAVPSSIPPPALPAVAGESAARLIVASPTLPEAIQVAPQEPAALTRGEQRAARVATKKLDALLASSSDLVVASSRVEAQLEQLSVLRESAMRVARLARSANTQSPDQLTQLADSFLLFERELDAVDVGLRREVDAVSTSTRRVDDEVRRLRMVPFREACEGLERAVRDLSQSVDKDVSLTLEGEQVEMDRELVQRLRDPLLHLVRNAVSHGIEARDVRRALGKPATARVVLKSALQGSLVEVSICDDGRGLDLAQIQARAREMGLPEANLDDEIAAHVFTPGLSTADKLTEISGRGVGLDAVKRTIENLHGTVTVSTTTGRGACFTLSLPLTLSKLRCLFVRVADKNFAVPTSHAVRVLRFKADQILRINGRELVRAESELVPLMSLASLLGQPELHRGEREQAQALVVSSAGRSVALITQDLLGERECIVHKLPPRTANAAYVSGATILPLGQVALVLNGSELGRAAIANVARPTRSVFAAPKATKRRVLVVDDSITTRALIKSIVEEGGYDVTAARDGSEAFRLLQEQPFELVVSDVQMPNMDGFALTENIRRTPKLARTPVVLVTSLEGESDRLRGLEAGANAYLGKSAFDHRVLLEVIGGLL